MPSDADVLVALAHVQIRAPGAGVAKLVQALREDHPDWHPPVDVRGSYLGRDYDASLHAPTVKTRTRFAQGLSNFSVFSAAHHHHHHVR